jgi:cytochrome c553
MSESQASKAYELMKTQCYTCHNPETEQDNLIAPPMIAVKMHYLRDDTTEDEFTQSILNFVNKPTKEKSKMKGAVKRFGVMPYQKFNEADIKAIASYMFNYKLDKPEWFDEHLKEGRMSPFKQKGKQLQMQKRKGPKQKGMNIAMATKKELGKNLMKALNEKGATNAVEFCNLKAIPITSEKEEQFNAKIKRASDRPRNPNNLATTREEIYINTFKEMIAKGESPEPIIEKNNGKFDFYYPIVTNSMCLKCHGEVGKTIKSETYKTIKLKYPEDKAIGYDVNQVRGIWHIEF